MYDANRCVVQISPTQLVKGPCSDQELEALRYVAQHTSVNLPRVRQVVRRRDGWWIVMDFIPGRRLDEAWPGMSGVEKGIVVEELWAMVGELRALPMPEELAGVIAVGSAETGGSVRDGALCTLDAVGPFEDIGAFQEMLRGNGNLAGFDRLFRNSPEEGDGKDRKSELYKMVFTHADLCPRNVIRGDDGKLYIIDWEFAGWWPGYWEYVKWHFADFPACPEFVGLLDEVSEIREILEAVGK